ncbi:MAG: DNA repair protein RecO [Ignavibacteriales bacterium]|nr:DNA repair protein RecO [Ignavibacteriales bacterium]
MSTIVKTEAVVLRSIDFKETSKIVTFYTRQFGKIAGMVKGARRPKSRFGTSLNPMSYVSLIIYKKEGREIQIVSQCDLIKPFRHLSEDIEKMAVGMAMIELVNIVTPEHAENAQLFLLLVNSLSSLNHAVKNPSNLLFYFEIHLARVLGFQPVLDHCVTCKKELKKINDDATYRFDIAKGGLACKRCSTAPG